MPNTKRLKVDKSTYKSTGDTIDLSNKSNFHENNLINVHNRKLEVFDRYVKSIPDDLLHIKNFCESLTNNTTHTLVKYMFTEYQKFCDLINETHHGTVYDTVLRDISQNKLTDFTIKFPNNKTMSCLKVILEQAPFFKMMFGEFIDLQTIDLNMNFNITSIIIKMLHKQNVTQSITCKNILAIFALLDKLLIEVNIVDFKPLLQFFSNN